MYLFDVKVFESLTKINSADGKIQLEKDILCTLIAEKTLYSYVCGADDFWKQIKTGSSVIPANRLYLQHFRSVAPK